MRVNVQKMEGILPGRLWTVNRLLVSVYYSRANGVIRLGHDFRRLVGIVKLTVLGR